MLRLVDRKERNEDHEVYRRVLGTHTLERTWPPSRARPARSWWGVAQTIQQTTSTTSIHLVYGANRRRRVSAPSRSR